MRILISIFTCLFIIGMNGCGAKVATLSGQVSLNEKPVVYGSVVAVAQNKQSFQGTIESDGSYAIHGIPRDIGELQITVHSPNPNPVSPRSGRTKAKGIRKGKELSKDEPVPHEETGNWFAIPEKYTKFGEAGLSVMIDGELVTYDIELK